MPKIFRHYKLRDLPYSRQFALAVVSIQSLILLSISHTILRADSASQPSQPAHIPQAETAVHFAEQAAVNVYGAGHRHIDWIPIGGDDHTVCSSFISLLLEHTYGWSEPDIKSWIGKDDPDAGDYYDAIKSQNGFTLVNSIRDIEPGDFICIKYFDGSTDTGHIMVVDSLATECTSTDKIVPGTIQYLVSVIDSSASGHGHADTRYVNGKFTGGIGEGTFRLYANPDGTIAGYTWSTDRDSVYYTSPARVLEVGRLTKTTP